MIGLVGRWGFGSEGGTVGYQGSWKIGIAQLGSGLDVDLLSGAW